MASKDVRTVRRSRVAAGLAAGGSLSSIARAEGVTRQTVAADARSPEVRQIIADLVDAHRPRIDLLFSRALNTIARGLYARQRHVSKDGVVTRVGPDHYARLTAAKRLLEYTLAGRPAPKAVEQVKDDIVTWDRVLEFLSSCPQK